MLVAHSRQWLGVTATIGSKVVFSGDFEGTLGYLETSTDISRVGGHFTRHKADGSLIEDTWDSRLRKERASYATPDNHGDLLSIIGFVH